LAGEFVQSELVPEAMASAVSPLLDHDSAERGRMLEDLAAVRDTLGAPGAAARVAEMVDSLVA
jgi:hypothetical protein